MAFFQGIRQKPKATKQKKGKTIIYGTKIAA
jgi:hypothetical protein